MQCVNCKEPVDSDSGFPSGDGYLCRNCFFDLSQRVRFKSLSDDEKKEIRRLVRDEMEGIMPRRLVLDLAEEFYDKLAMKSVAFEEAANDHARSVERIAFIAMAREMIKFLDVLHSVIDEQKRELYDKIRKVSAL